MVNNTEVKIIPISEEKVKQRKSYLSNKLEKINESKKIKIRVKKRKNDYHLYLDYSYHGKKRERKFLKIFVTDTRNKFNEEKIKKVVMFRDKKEIELFGITEQKKFELENSKLKVNFIRYFENLVVNKKNNSKPWRHTLRHLKIFSKNNIVTFDQVTKSYCNNFKIYLERNLSQNSAHTYFAKLRAALNQAISDDILNKANPAQLIIVKKQRVARQSLDIEEIKLLIDTPCKNDQSKQAFLFSCFTGLRISDVKKLNWDEINNGYLYIRQKKTDDPIKNKLNKTTKKILNAQKKLNITNNRVFNLVNSDNNINIHIKDWVKNAGINKKITFHCSRHTFATLLLNSDVSIYTVKEYMGQKNVIVTQEYVKLANKVKDKEIDKLPEFEIS